VATEAQISHATRKMTNARKTKEDLAKNQTQLEAKVAALQQELATVGKAAERAQGAVSFYRLSVKLIFQ
jgi:structural maintenance of chromosome 1